MADNRFEDLKSGPPILRFRRGPGIAIGPAAFTWFQIRRPTLSASAMMAASSIVRTLRSRITKRPSIITVSMSEGWPL